MRKLPAIIIIVVLLTSVVGYLAIDRTEKNVATERNKSFDDKFAR
jgi:hypothetical protein